MLDNLIKKLNESDSTIGIIGLGYVGLPLSLAYVDAGFNVIGFDVDQQKINYLKNGESYINHIDRNKLKKAIDERKFIPNIDMKEIGKVDAIIICVPTPLDIHREPDLSYVSNTVKSIMPYIKRGQVVSLESTTYPGTTEKYLKKPIEEMGWEPGKDIYVVYSPEREDPGNKNYSTSEIAKVVGGSTKNCLRGVRLYTRQHLAK